MITETAKNDNGGMLEVDGLVDLQMTRQVTSVKFMKYLMYNAIQKRDELVCHDS